MITDKLPLFALALAAAVMTMLTHGGHSADPLTLPERLANAAVVLRRLSRATIRPGGTVAVLFLSRGGPAGLAGRRRRRVAFDHHGGGGDLTADRIPISSSAGFGTSGCWFPCSV